MLPTIKRKINTFRRITENPDELRLFLLSRLPSMSPTSYLLRWLYPAWWRYLLHRLTSFGRKKVEFKKSPLSRFLLRIPNVAGIGDQIVTSWSETYMLAREYKLTFVHHPFVKGPHDSG